MDVMDIANLAVNMSQAKVMTDVGTAILDMTLDTCEAQASEMIKLMESSVQPNLGQNFETYI